MEQISRRPPAAGSFALAAGLLLCGLLAACGQQEQAQRPPLETLTLPQLDGLEPAVADQWRTAFEQWRRAVTDPDRPAQDLAAAAGELGRILHAYGELDLAEAAYVNAGLLAPQNHVWPYLRGTLLQERGDVPASIAPLEAAVKIDPRDLPARFRLARAFLMQGQPEPAKQHLQRSIELDPSSAMAYYLAGQLELADGRADSALVAFEHTLRLQPQADSVHAAMAAALISLGETTRAEHHRRLAGKTPVQADDPMRFQVAALAISSTDFMRRAYEARMAGHLQEAVDLHRRAVDAAPRSARAHSALGAILAETGALDQALKEMRKAQRLGAQDPQIIGNLAEVHRLRGEYGEAAAAHRRVLEISPEDQRSKLGLARTLAAAGAPDEAIEAYEEVLRDKPENAQAASERDALVRTAPRSKTQPTAATATSLAQP